MAVPLRRPTLLVLGHVTRDLFGKEARLGGAASFAGQAAALLGVDTAIVTVAPPDAPELGALRGLPRLQLEVAPDSELTTFEHTQRGSRRSLALLARARPLTWDDVPPEWRAPDVVYAGPVAGECDEGLLSRFGGAYGIGCIQGWLRDPVVGRRVRPRPLPAECRLPALLSAVCFSASDHPGGAAIARELARQGAHVAVTRGRRGARVTWPGHEHREPAAPAREVDATGAGDVYALVFGLSLYAGHAPPQAARRAALAAARVVEGPGLGTLSAEALPP